MTRKRISRLDVAICIRDAALEKVKKDGQFENTNCCPLLTWQGDDLCISHTTPFQVFPPPSDEVLEQCYAAGVDPKFDLPYGLDIWDKHCKVFNVEWDYQNNVNIINFKRGEWEEIIHCL